MDADAFEPVRATPAQSGTGEFDTGCTGINTGEAASFVFGAGLPSACRYHDLLATEGTTRGIIGPRETPRLWERHLLNSAIIAAGWPSGAHVTDVGTGGGLPGIPIAIARPDLVITLVEPLLRRTDFLEEVIGELGLGDRVSVCRGRAEDSAVLSAAGNADIVTSRAVAPLAKLASWCLPLTRPGGWVRAMKGVSAADELARDRAAVERLGGREFRVDVMGAGVVEVPTYLVSFRRDERGVTRHLTHRNSRR